MTEQPSRHQHLDEPRRRFGRRWLDLTSENHILIAPLISLAAFICIALGNKSLVAALIALVGTYRGFEVRDSSRELGRRTTQAVVESIFMVLLIDAIFAVVYWQVDF